jgi:hypothetical protein
MDEGIGVMEAGVAPAVREDFPQLRLWVGWIAVPPGRRSGDELRGRLAEVDDRVRRLPVGGLRVDPVASAYRAFARQIGLDPDAERNPLEQLAVDRLVAGRLVSGGPLADATTVAMLETGVPLWAIDAEHLAGWPRVDVDGAGRLVIADDGRALVPLMAAPAPALAPTIHRRVMSTALVYALQVGKVPAATVAEAFWHLRTGVAGREVAR